MTHSTWLATPFQSRTISGGAGPIASSLSPKVGLSKTGWIRFQTARREDFGVHPSLAVHIDLWLMTQRATQLGAPLEENFRAWPGA